MHERIATPAMITTTTTAATPTAATGPADARSLTITLRVIAAFQFALGAAFLLAPSRAAHVLGLVAAPGWVDWLLAMLAVRCIGYGAGMVAASRAPRRHRLWIQTMVAIQLIDWVATMVHLATGDVTLGQVTTAAVVPVLFAAVLGRWLWTTRP